MAARYSRVERKFWRDEKVRQLSDQARTLMLYLLTCDANCGFPGLFLLRLSAVAEDLEWSVDTVRLRFSEIARLGMARRDDVASVVWLPNAIKKQVDELSTNNARGWRRAWAELPDCHIVRAAFVATVDAMRAHDDATKGAVLAAEFAKRSPAWFSDTPEQRSLFGEPPPNPLRTPSEGGGYPPPNKDRESLRTGKGQGASGVEGVHAPTLTEHAQGLYADLVDERPRMFPDAADVDLAWCADGMARAAERSAGDRYAVHGGAYLSEAIPLLGSWLAENQGANAKKRLAELERRFGWRVDEDAKADHRKGRELASELTELRHMPVAS